MEAYSRLTRLPPPRTRPVSLGPLLHRAGALETRVHVVVTEGPEITLCADPDQVEQLVINLLRNAADATLELATGASPAAPIELAWAKLAAEIEITVADAGPGFGNSANLFVPFFTTKPKGSSIGLTLCRQIAESHGGTLTLENRTDRSGAMARFRIPLT